MFDDCPYLEICKHPEKYTSEQLNNARGWLRLHEAEKRATEREN